MVEWDVAWDEAVDERMADFGELGVAGDGHVVEVGMCVGEEAGLRVEGQGVREWAEVVGVEERPECGEAVGGPEGEAQAGY